MHIENSATNKALASVARNAGYGVVGQCIFLFLRFLTAIIITRAIGPKDYGIYMLAMSLVSVVQVIGLVGLEPAMIKFVSQFQANQELNKVKKLVTFGLKTTLCITALISAVLFIFSSQVAIRVFHKPDLDPVLSFMLIGTPLTTAMLVMLASMQGARLIKFKILVQQIFMPSIRIVAIGICLALGYRVIGLAWVWTVTAAAGCGLATFLCYRWLARTPGPFEKINKRDIFAFSLPLLMSRIFNQNINMIGILLIGMFLSSSEVGIYGVAIRTLPFLMVPFIAFNDIMKPIFSALFAQKQMEEMESIFKAGCRWVILTTLPLFLLMVLFADDIVRIFGSGFSESAKVMLILLVGRFVNVATGSTGFVLIMTGRSLVVMGNSALLFVLNIVLTVFMLQRFGIMGAAYAYSFSIIVIQVLQFVEVWLFYRIHPYSLSNFKAVAAAIVAGFTVLVIKNLLGQHEFWASPYLLVPVFISCYLAVVILAGFNREDRMILTRIRQKFGRRVTEPVSC